MADNPIYDAVIDGEDVPKGEFRAAFTSLGMFFESLTVFRNTDTRGQKAVIIGGLVWAYDPADTTTADDGVNCIIDLSGVRRYKRQPMDGSAEVATHVAQPDPHAQYALDTDLVAHAGNTSNPHGVTKAQVGLGSVDNVSASALRDRATHIGIQDIGVLNESINYTLNNIEWGADALGEWAASVPSGLHNIALGNSSLGSISSGSNNIAFGFLSLLLLTATSENIAIGFSAGYQLVAPSRNTIIGVRAQEGPATGVDDVVLIGHSAGQNNTAYDTVAVGAAALANNTGTRNTALGRSAGVTTTSGSRQTLLGWNAGAPGAINDVIAIGANAAASVDGEIVFGTSAMFKLRMFGIDYARYQASLSNFWFGDAGPLENPTGPYNLGIGPDAVNTVTSGTNNLGIGKAALEFQTTGNNNVAIGVVAAQFAETIADSVYVGHVAGRYNVSGVGATVLGFRAHEHNASAANNVAVGDSALWHTQGSGNVAIGYIVAEGMSQGDQNVIIGRAAAKYRDNGNNNVLIGHAAGSIASNSGSGIGLSGGPGDNIGGVAAGHNNIGIGANSLLELLGSNVVAVGHEAGKSLVGTAALDMPNVFIGKDSGNSGSQKTDAANSIAIGPSTFTTKDNQAVLGNSSIAETVIRGVTLSTVYTVAGLPSAVTMGAGARAFVSNASGPVFGSAVAGGGAVNVPVYSDGAVWRVG
jgi:hypothetical protein